MAYLHKLGQIKQETGGEREGGTHPPKSSFVMSMREINSSIICVCFGTTEISGFFAPESYLL